MRVRIVFARCSMRLSTDASYFLAFSGIVQKFRIHFNYDYYYYLRRRRDREWRRQQSFKKYVKTLACKCNQMVRLLQFVLLLKLFNGNGSSTIHLDPMLKLISSCRMNAEAKNKQSKTKATAARRHKSPTNSVFVCRYKDLAFFFNSNGSSMFSCMFECHLIRTTDEPVVKRLTKKHMSPSALNIQTDRRPHFSHATLSR